MSPLTNTIVLAIAGLATQASASTIKVAVGKSGLTFAPDTVTASAGDVLEFHFYAKNHSVVMGDWTDACVPAKTGGFYSGFFPTAANTSNAEVFSVTINDTTPIAFYCSQNTGSHCKNGMVGVVNPSGENTLEAYQAKAKSVSSAESPATVFGGVVSAAPAASSTGTETGASSTASSTSSSSASASTKPNGAASLGVSSVTGMVAIVGAAALFVY